MYVGKQDAGVAMKMISFQNDVAYNLIYEITIELTVWKDNTYRGEKTPKERVHTPIQNATK